MKLSIIIPFNRYIHYLYDCLESIKDQNLTDYEVLLVVDAIEDVKDKIHKYNLPITLIESDEATVGKKRNMGLNHAKGEYDSCCSELLLPLNSTGEPNHAFADC